ncbi:MAG: DUF1624 domain-containing protein, partial [Rhizobiales bacterium]|nr:DUF1624 domain-containing protein [Hyphomicrobiales bacterium]
RIFAIVSTTNIQNKCLRSNRRQCETPAVTGVPFGCRSPLKRGPYSTPKHTGTFMFLVGVSLVLAHHDTIRVRAFIRRLLTIALCAAAITVVTWFAFPESFIYFGILHAIAAATLLGMLFLRANILVCLAAVVIVLSLPLFLDLSEFNTRWLAWTGFAERPPPSNDFVPIFPWVGVTLLGMASAKLFLLRHDQNSPADAPVQGSLVRLLIWMGHWSLLIYLVHQPILLSIIVPLSRMVSAQG